MGKGIVLYGAFGDIAAISAASHHFSNLFNENFALVTSPEFVNFSRIYGNFSKVIPFNFSNPRATIEQIIGSDIGKLYDCHNTSYFDEKHLQWLSEINLPVVIGTSRFNAIKKDNIGKFIVVPDRVISNSVHNVENYMGKMGLLDFKIYEGFLKLSPTSEDKKSAKAIKERYDGKVIGVIPKSRFPHKELSDGLWNEILSGYSKSHSIVILCSDVEYDSVLPLANKVSANILTSPNPEGHVRNILSADLLLSIDTGIKHVAGYLGQPVISVYGPSDPLIWGTRSPSEIVVQGSASCAPCNNPYSCKYETLSCLSSLPVESIRTKIATFLGEAK